MKITPDHIHLFESLTFNDRQWIAEEVGGPHFPPSQVTVMTVASLRSSQLRDLEERIRARPLPLWEPHEDLAA